MIRKAKSSDMADIMDIIHNTIKGMKYSKNYQWDSKYPQPKHFESDIESGNLYISEGEKGKICGMICINFEEPEEYTGLKWSLNKKAMVLHRMAVSHDCRNQGVGSLLMKFAEELAVKNGTLYIKSDTYSTNELMNYLFRKLQYKLIGEMNFQGRELPFYCYEKQIGKKENT